jgi:hypothetical protein
LATLASITLHGLRLPGGPGSKVVVLGLGLIGQLASARDGLRMRRGRDRPNGFAREAAARAGVLALDKSGFQAESLPSSARSA